MMRDLFTEYTCTPASETDLAGLAELGITIKPPAGTVCLWPGEDGEWSKEIGCIIVWDDTRQIDCIPYRHIDSDDIGFLAAIAFNAWIAPPTPERRWGHATTADGRGYWHQTISAAVQPEDTESVRVIASAASHRERNDRALGFDAA